MPSYTRPVHLLARRNSPLVGRDSVIVPAIPQSTRAAHATSDRVAAYGAGLRRGEVLDLSVADVDLANSLLTIRNTKFFKSRLVPIGPDLTKVLSDYASLAERLRIPRPVHGSTFFVGRDGAKRLTDGLCTMPSSDCGNMPACGAPMAVASNLGCTICVTPSRSIA